jgi:hypothetical protein
MTGRPATKASLLTKRSTRSAHAHSGSLPCELSSCRPPTRATGLG